MNDTNAAGGSAVNIVILSRCIGYNLFMNLSICNGNGTYCGHQFARYSCARTRRLYQKLYQTVLNCQHKITILQQLWMQCELFVGDTDTYFQSMENAVYVYVYVHVNNKCFFLSSSEYIWLYFFKVRCGARTYHALLPPPSHHHLYIIHLINWLQHFHRIRGEHP